MSQQLQITGGAKVRDLNDVIIGTSGVLSSLAFNVANGVPKLDSNAKILVSQLPNSVMEYQGTWNAATNTPTLTNGGAFNQGDVYLCNVAGTVNFGAGPISFIVGDSAIYSGSIWQRSGGATGSVTSVGLSTDGNAITIGNSPITTSGTITANFNGTNLQYVNGAGNLTTFPTLISSIGLSMPSAFSVSNSPLTANGTIAVTGAGYPSQYIRGDGTLADFPTSGGGGSSVSYYLNGGTSQGTIGGVTYYEMSKTADTGTGVDFPKSGDGLIVSFLTDAGDPAQLNIPAGNWNYEIYASMSANGGTPQMYAELYKYDGTTFTLIATSSNEILYDGVNLNLYTFAMTVPATTLTLTDRLAVKLYATNSGGKTTTVHTQDSHLCQVITTFSTGITALNGLTAQVQYFGTGTSGTDFNISSTTATHTFNIPDASASARGLITTGTQTIAGIKTFNLSTKNETGIQLKNDIGIVPVVTGYTNLNGLSNGLAITNSAGVSNNLLVPSTTGYSYTFPNATGTLALLENAQTFSGAKTFSGFASFTSTSGTNTQYGIYLSKGSTPTAFSTTTVNIYSDVTTNNLVIRDNSSTANLVFNNSTQTYTFPAASGTIALTSSLASYVPYTGATANVDLGLFSLKSNGVLAYGNGTAGGIVSFTQTGTLAGVATGAASIGSVSAGKLNIYFGDSGLECVELDNSLLTASRTYNFPNASGTLALTSQIPSNIVTGTGASGRLAYWNGTSTQTSDGNLTWDSTYSALSSITFYALNSTKAAFNLSSNTDNVGKIQNVTATSWSLAYGTADLSFPKGTSVLTWNSSGQVGIGNTSPSYTLDVSGTAKVSSTLLVSGAATLSSTLSVTGNTGIGVAADSNVRLEIQGSNTSSGHYIFYTMDSAGSPLFNLQNNGTTYFKGNVGIGVTSPASRLEVRVAAESPATGAVALIAGTSNGNNDIFRWYDGTTQLGVFKNSGNVGIGNSSPTVLLSVGTSQASPVSTADLTLGLNRYIMWGTSGSGASTVRSWGIANNELVAGDFVIKSSSTNNNTLDTVRLQITNAGVVTISALGSGTVTATSGTLSAVSDMNLKIEDGFIDNALEKVLNLKPRYFLWKEESGLPTDLRQLGFYAQEVNEALGEEVANTPKDENQNWGIYDRGIIAMLTKAIQELSQQNDELKARLDNAGL